MPHSGPFARGIHVTVQARAGAPARLAQGVLAALREFYARAPFVRVTEARAARQGRGRAATTRTSQRSADGRTVAVMCAIDNLTKGAAGGAVQWMNRLFGLPETAGLTAPAAGLDLRARTMSKHKRISATTDSGIRAAARQHEFLAPVFAQYPLEVASAQGVWLTTSRGERVLDLYGGHAVAALGYGHPAWTAALAAPGRAAASSRATRSPCECAPSAARRLVRFSRLPFASVFFVNSGAEANENALKMALRMTGRAHVAAIEGGFHGRTAAAGAVTWGAQREVVRLPAHPLRRELHPARRRSRDRRAR